MYKRLTDDAIEQAPDEQLYVHTLDPESNSIAVIVKHMAGNMRSRWTDFLTIATARSPTAIATRNSKRRRTTRPSCWKMWEDGWRYALRRARAAERRRRIANRDDPHRAAFRDASDQSPDGPLFHHIGQIVFLAKHFAATNWNHHSPDGNPRSSPQPWPPASPRKVAVPWAAPVCPEPWKGCRPAFFRG